jgi:hypothetical protein
MPITHGLMKIISAYVKWKIGRIVAVNSMLLIQFVERTNHEKN